MNKLQDIIKQIRPISKKITSTAEEWTSYLTAGANMYKYSFDDKLLIYMQCPTATACATIPQWNSINHRVNYGTKGIAIIRNENGKSRLEYVFDISNTHAVKGSKKVNYWQVFPQHHAAILSQLEQTYGTVEVGNFESKLMVYAQRIVEQNYKESYEKLLNSKGKSLLSELDDTSIDEVFYKTLLSSVQYTLLSRCGINANEYFSQESFEGIKNFNTPATLSCIGNAASKLSETLLREIEHSVKQFNRNISQKDLANSAQMRYTNSSEFNTLNHESVGGIINVTGEKENNTLDRGTRNHLSSGGRLSDTRHGDRTGTTGSRDIRQKTPEIHTGGKTRTIFDLEPNRRTESISGGNQRTGMGENRPDNRPDDETKWNQRSTQGSRPNEMGTGNELHQNDSRGNRVGRTDIQLNKPENTKAEGNASSAFSISTERLNSALLCTIDTLDAKFKIYECLQSNLSEPEIIDFIQQQIGNSFHSLENEKGIIQTNKKDGILIQFQNPNHSMLLTWQDMTVQMQSMLQPNQFLSSDEYLLYTQNKQEKEDTDIKIIFDEKRNPIPQQEQSPVLEQNNSDCAETITNTPIDLNEQKSNLSQSEKVIAVGEEIKLDGKNFIVDEIDDTYGEVRLKYFFKNSHIPPIFQQVPLDYVISQLNKEKNNLTTKDENINNSIILPETIQNTDNNTLPHEAVQSNQDSMILSEAVPINHESTILSEAIQSNNDRPIPLKSINDSDNSLEKINFQIMDENLGLGGAKTKFAYNLAALQTLKQIEAENRFATLEEQEILSKYVGWGSLSQAFDSHNPKWEKEYHQLKSILTEKEYTQARSTTLNAYYTPPFLIKAIYKALEQTGFQTGNLLEPSCGIGNFFGLLPEKMKNVNLYGVELDSITGRIARQLYPNADITISGYEKTQFPNNFFDVAIGNVPFGDYKPIDSQYIDLKFHIHDFFFAKTLDKVRSGGIIAFITTKGVLDKQDNKVRKYIAQRADLLGAIRLPNTAFQKNAGTEVTTDILFLQKRKEPLEIEPNWINIGKTNDGVPINQYFLQHPEMVLGKMAFWRNMYGSEQNTACLPFEGKELSELLDTAIQNLHLPSLPEIEPESLLSDNQIAETSIPVPENSIVKNFSFTVIDDKLYFRENQNFNFVSVKEREEQRIKGLIQLRDTTRTLIDAQLQNCSEEQLQSLQKELHTVYDSFVEKYGFVGSKENKRVFKEDISYPLLCSLEILNDDKTVLEQKADMFFKRTIQVHEPVTHADNSFDALTVSLNEKGCVDLRFMSNLMGGFHKIPQITEDLKGIIFKNPLSDDDSLNGWESADEYLSGNVREKLEIVRIEAKKNPDYTINVEKLEQVQPKDLTPAEIDVRLGSTWVDPKYYEQFMFELFQTSAYYKSNIQLFYSKHSNRWYIQGKNKDSNNAIAKKTYGTDAINGYEILEKTLNLQEIVIKKSTENSSGESIQVTDEAATALAQEKQTQMQAAFQKWIWEEPERRDILCKKYNELFNNLRPREYDGSHLQFHSMNPEIHLRPHQLNAVARQLYGKNTLLAHVVGAGKTYVMIAAAMESKRMGLNHKSLIVVPNHLTEQWGTDFLRLYPNANILVANKKDFETENRKKFCSRIATGNFDAVIIGHSQFGKIPITPEREEEMIQEEIEAITQALENAVLENKKSYTVKQMEKTKKKLLERLDNTRNRQRQDDVVYFEELGIDKLYVDEAHEFKNMFVYTKMQNVAGVNSNSNVLKTKDMLAKCRYIDEITGGHGIVFATGTPIANSITELFTMMNYLQHDMLQKLDLHFFDNWASCFAEKVTDMEIAPEGKGFRLKTRLANFFNLPELMNIWKESADIVTADMLPNIEKPTPQYINVVTKPTEHQLAMVDTLADRADKVRTGQVDRHIDNMLRITTDGRKLALDQRMINPLLSDEPESKVNTCVNNIYADWEQSMELKGTQLVFCDMSTPQKKKKSKTDLSDTESFDTELSDTEAFVTKFCVYEDIKEKLISKGIPKEEIAFIHDYNTEEEKAKLFSQVRSGKVRILLGSSSKMGAGVNVQKRLVSLHHLDCPWKPSDIE